MSNSSMTLQTVGVSKRLRASRVCGKQCGIFFTFESIDGHAKTNRRSLQQGVAFLRTVFSERQDFRTGFGHQNCVLKLRRQ